MTKRDFQSAEYAAELLAEQKPEPVCHGAYGTPMVYSAGGILVPVVEPEPPAEPEPEFPVLAGWHYSKLGDRYYESQKIEFQKRAIEDLYTAISPGGGGIALNGERERMARCERLLNELAVELVGGVPEDYEEYC